ncbi:hypothetical protein H4217_000206 [Coemansia sp. RSA 1939]|nr:hypothetical protein H4217_000206 [Coemansia sp. RSA 1939]
MRIPRVSLMLAIAALLLCVAVAAGAEEPRLSKRKGGGGGGHGGGGGGGHGSSGGGGGKPSSSGSSSSSSSSSKAPSTSSGIKGGGGSNGKGSGSYGDRPPSYASLFPARSGYNAGGRGIGNGDASHPYAPPPAYSAQANYGTINRGQTVPTYTIGSKNPPSAYYASPYRTTYPGAWGYGFYPIFPYPWWAYGAGGYVGASYVGDSYHHGIYTYTSEFRNVTVANATSIPVFDNMDLFGSGVNVTYVDFNNGTVRLGPCGNATSSAFANVSAADCTPVFLDIKRGRVVSGNARSYVDDEITFFSLTLGSNSTVLRTMTISSTRKSARGGIVAGIVIGCVAFVVLVGLAAWLVVRWRRKKNAAAS